MGSQACELLYAQCLSQHAEKVQDLPTTIITKMKWEIAFNVTDQRTNLVSFFLVRYSTNADDALIEVHHKRSACLASG